MVGSEWEENISIGSLDWSISPSSVSAALSPPLPVSVSAPISSSASSAPPVTAPATTSPSLLLHLVLSEVNILYWIKTQNSRFCYFEVRGIPNSVISPSLPSVQFTPQLPADWFEMHEVAEPRSGALSGLVLATTRLAEVRHRGQLGVYWPASKPTVVEVTAGFLGVLKTEI